jgi:hypothetical protein
MSQRFSGQIATILSMTRPCSNHPALNRQPGAFTRPALLADYGHSEPGQLMSRITLAYLNVASSLAFPFDEGQMARSKS